MKTLKIKIKPLPFLVLIAIMVFGCESKNKSKESTEGVIPTSKYLSVQKVISAVADSINLEINNGKYGLIDRFMVIQNEKLLADFKYEQDYETIAQKFDTTNHQYNYNHPNWHPYYKKTNLHTLQSATKSITSILVGIALDSNKDFDVNTTVASLFDNYDVQSWDNKKQEMTVEDLLTMRSGLKWNEADYTDPLNDCVLLEESDEWVKFILDKPLDTIPGAKFNYNSGASVLLGKIVRIITGKRIDKWAEEKLFDPLGINDYYWKETPDGENDTEGGLYLSSQDLSKIGLLFLNKGRWNETQIVSENWITDSTSPIVEDTNRGDKHKIGYGYQWWIPEHTNGKSIIYSANGFGGQFLMVAPEYELLVIFNGWNINDRAEKSTFRVLQDRLIPALKNE